MVIICIPIMLNTLELTSRLLKNAAIYLMCNLSSEEKIIHTFTCHLKDVLDIQRKVSLNKPIVFLKILLNKKLLKII